MSYYLMLLKIRDISAHSSIFQKAKKYIKPGQKAPKGVHLHKGPKGGTYYNTEDVKALKESQKKDKPNEESGEKKKRLPAFRKQDDGTVLHRTKDGQHGPGAYRIESTDGEHHLTFEDKNGFVQSLGKHGDIKELKRMVAGFKGGEKKEAPIRNKLMQKELDAVNNRIAKRMKSREHIRIGITPEERQQEDDEYREGYLAVHEFLQTDNALSPTHVQKWISSMYGSSSAQNYGAKEALRDVGTWHSKSTQKRWRDTSSVWRNLKPKDISDEDIGINKPAEDTPVNQLEQNVNRLSIEHGKYVDVLEQVNKQGDLGHTRTISTPGIEEKPFSSGDKRHDQDQDKPSLSRLREFTMNHPNVSKLPDEQKAEVTRALDDMESTLNRSKSIDSFKRAITRRRNQIQKQPGYDMENQGIYESTLNTILQADDDWYHPEKKEFSVKKQKAKTKTSAHSLTELRIKQDMVNAGLDPESHDVSSLIDKTLNYRENRANVARRLGYSYRQKDKKEAKQRADHHQCIQAQERCEVHGDNGACLQYHTMGCDKTYGSLDR